MSNVGLESSTEVIDGKAGFSCIGGTPYQFSARPHPLILKWVPQREVALCFAQGMQIIYFPLNLKSNPISRAT